MRLVVDIEADDLLEDVKLIHCICAKDIDTGDEYSYDPDQLQQALLLLSDASCLIGHNVVAYDLPVLEKILNWTPSEDTAIIDTLVMSRLCFSDIINTPRKEWGRPPAKKKGSHGLEAWGYRLHFHKGDFGDKDNAWEIYTIEMLEYCLNDVLLTEALLLYLNKVGYTQESFELEMGFAFEAYMIEKTGFTYNTKKARILSDKLEARQATVVTELQSIVPSKKEGMKTPKNWIVTWEDGSKQEFPTKGSADIERKARNLKPAQVSIERGVNRVRETLFNPNSTKQVREHLFNRYKWRSYKLTPKGEERMAEESLSFDQLIGDYGSLDADVMKAVSSMYPEAKLIAESMMLTKRLGQICNGENAWDRCVKPDGKIHHQLLHIGANTHRTAHRRPNMSQVVGVAKPHGSECRELFEPEEGDLQVGVDIAQIEGRLLAHFLSPYDKGAYINEILRGDIHVLNVNAIKEGAGFTISRGDSKTVYYAWIYGCGPLKTGLIMAAHSADAREEWQSLRNYYNRNPLAIKTKKYIGNDNKKVTLSSDEAAYHKIGSATKDSLEAGIDGLQHLLNSVKTAAKRGYLMPLDGRKIPIRSVHSALNALLQGSAAIVFKRWVVDVAESLKAQGMGVKMMLLSHDEIQASVAPKWADRYSEMCLDKISRVGERYRLALPLEAEAKTGTNWMETH